MRTHHSALTTRRLPDPALEEDWNRVLGIDELKAEALQMAALAVTVRGAGVPFAALPIHGLLLFTGRPGVGKTTLARGLAQHLATVMKPAYPNAVLVEINPHTLSSDLLGKSQKAVREILEEHLAALAQDALVVAIIDEVESFAVARSEASLAANPVDVHRATDAVLDGLDRLAREAPNLIIIATTNFPEGVDAAFRSRADRVFEFPLPDDAAIRAILADTIDALRATFPKMPAIPGAVLGELAGSLSGMDGRAVRKFVLEALGRDIEVALAPEKLRASHLLAASRSRPTPARVAGARRPRALAD